MTRKRKPPRPETFTDQQLTAIINVIKAIIVGTVIAMALQWMLAK